MRTRLATTFAASVLVTALGAFSPVSIEAAVASGPLVYTGADGLPWTAKLDGTGAHRLVPAVVGETWGPPAWSANGNLIVAVRKSTSDPAGKGRIVLMDPNGAAVASYSVPLAYANCVDYPPHCASGFNPDGAKVVYGSGAGLRILNRATGTTTLIQNTAASADWPTWAPGGALIAYRQAGAVVVIAPTGTGKNALRSNGEVPCPTSCYESFGSPEWRPNGNLLIPRTYSSSGGGCGGGVCNEWQLEVVNPSTGDSLNLTHWVTYDTGRVAITPNGKSLVVRKHISFADWRLAKTPFPPAPPPGQAFVDPVAMSIDGTAPDVSRAPTVAPLTPNGSIVFLKPGRMVTGTLVNGAYVQKSATTAGTWTAAAVSRDSLALYNAKTGALRTGTFRNGVFTVKKNLTLAKGFTQIAATCDSLVLYNGANGKAVAATLRKGLLGTKRRNYTFASGNPKLVTTCDTLQLAFGNSSTRVGLLTQGRWTRLADAGAVPTGALMAGTADSYLRIASAGGGLGQWGTLYAGDATHVNQANSFSAWTKIAGTATSVLFYNGSITATTKLVGGVYTGGGAGPNIGSGWTIIAGGR